jgi:nucleotide-binding universal stress UspA family protein
VLVETVVLGYDDSDAAKAAQGWTIDYVQRRGDARIVQVYVVSSILDWELSAVQVDTDRLRHAARERLEGPWSEPLRAAGVTHTSVLRLGRPGSELRAAAQEEDASLLVLGMSTRGTLTELLFGSSTRAVLHEAHRPVVVVPPDWAT